MTKQYSFFSKDKLIITNKMDLSIYDKRYHNLVKYKGDIFDLFKTLPKIEIDQPVRLVSVANQIAILSRRGMGNLLLGNEKNISKFDDLVSGPLKQWSENIKKIVINRLDDDELYFLYSGNQEYDQMGIQIDNLFLLNPQWENYIKKISFQSS